MKLVAAIVCTGLFVGAAYAQPAGMDIFSDGKNADKTHEGSGFVCPYTIGPFVRDATGESDPEQQTATCNYSTHGGVYGTITLSPLRSNYEPKASLAAQFEQQQATGGKVVWQGTTTVGAPPLAVYSRLYQTARLEDLKYTVLYSSSAVKNWVVETTIEYADPRDKPEKDTFFNGVYEAALAQIGK